MEEGAMRVAIALLFVLSATVLLVSMQSSPDAAIQTKIIALEKAWNQAYKRADTRALNLILDDHIVLIKMMAARRPNRSFYPASSKLMCRSNRFRLNP
jgi:hypothetical protein